MIQTSSFTVMVIDDEIVQVNILKALLEDYNCRVIAYTDPQLAIKYLMEQKKDIQPDIIITDYNLKITDGIQLSNQIKKLNPDIFIIAVTGYNDAATLQKMDKEGSFNFIIKKMEVHYKIYEALDSISKKRKP